MTHQCRREGTNTYKMSGLHIVPEHLHHYAARQQDGGQKTKVYHSILELHSSVYIAIWGSPSHSMSAIVLPQDLTIHHHHHHHLPEVLSLTITYILNIHLKRVELPTHLDGALHAVPRTSLELHKHQAKMPESPLSNSTTTSID